MQFNILITGGLYSTQAGLSAWQFARAAVSSGHTISQVFFYQDAVLHGTQFSVPMQDEVDVIALWAEFASEHQVPLMVCVSAAERRGVLSEPQAAEHGLEHFNIHPQYEIAGLGVLHEAAMMSDRMVTFR